MAVICDKCGTDKSVRRAFMTMWNGNIIDLCRICYKPLVKIIDDIAPGYGTLAGKAVVSPLQSGAGNGEK